MKTSARAARTFHPCSRSHQRRTGGAYGTHGDSPTGSNFSRIAANRMPISEPIRESSLARQRRDSAMGGRKYFIARYVVATTTLTAPTRWMLNIVIYERARAYRLLRKHPQRDTSLNDTSRRAPRLRRRRANDSNNTRPLITRRDPRYTATVRTLFSYRCLALYDRIECK